MPSGRRALLVVVIGIASYLMALKGNEPRRNRVLGEGKTPRLAAGLHNMPARGRYLTDCMVAIGNLTIAKLFSPCNRSVMTNLAAALSAYQQKHDVQGKDLAKAIGIHQSTLTRLKQGKMPDADGLTKIMIWLTRHD